MLKIFFSILFCATCFCATAQDKNISSFLKKLEETTNRNTQEKIHLHLDKPYYSIGDDIWFKAYTVNAKTGEPSTISSILYVELINEQNFISHRLKLPMKSGITWGDFKLSDSLSEGNYRIRAYTQWMRNDDTAFFFDKTIKIGNSWTNNVFTKTEQTVTKANKELKITSSIRFANKSNAPYINCEVSYQIKLNGKTAASGKRKTDTAGKITLDLIDKQPELKKEGIILTSIVLPEKYIVQKEIPLKITSNDIDIHFLPEGGKTIAGVNNRIAVKTINPDGLGEHLTGSVLDRSGKEVAKFETNKLGMGSFEITPKPQEAYHATLKFSNGHHKNINLPPVEQSGASLSIDNHAKEIMFVKINLSDDLLNKDDFYLLAQKNGIIYFSKKVSSNKKNISLAVPKTNFPSGILTITLFDSKLQPLNERIVFINNLQDKISVIPENLKESYGTRQKVNLSFSTTNNDNPIQGSFSIAVTNTDAVKPDPENESNILTSLLLTADLKGYIEKPNYYFLNNDSKTIADLDLLMLTQGWRKINWKSISDTSFRQKPTISVEKSLRISGTVTKGGKPVVNGKITLASLKGIIVVADTTTDENGRFVFDKIELKDTLKYVIQARTEKDRKFVNIALDTYPYQAIAKNPNTGDIEINVNQTIMDYLTDNQKYLDNQTKKGLLNKTIQLKEVNIVKKRPTSKQYDELMLPGILDISVNAKDLENVPLLSRYLTALVGNLSIDHRGMLSVPRRNIVIFLDGLKYNERGFDYNIDDINVDNIQTIEILKDSQGEAFNVPRNSFVVVISTKTGLGITSVSQYTPGVVKGELIGYSPSRVFYAPRYDIKPDTEPDLRTTVLWEPQIISDTNGKFKLDYYNTDIPGTYRMVIEGIDGSGNLARKVFLYNVK